MLNRIIGILVVLAVGVLIYPFAFNSHDHFSGHTDGIRMPAFPSSKTQNDTIQALSQNNESAIAHQAKNTRLASVANKPKKIIADKKHVKAGYKNVVWVVHVGTYHDKVEALSLVNQLRAKGYNAFIHQTPAAFGDAMQVYIGPEAKRDAAALVAAQLAKDAKLSGVIKTYKLLSA